MKMENKPLRHASVFTGIGGFDLAALRVGWDNVFQCEIDPFCQEILKYHFPGCELFPDIKTSKFDKYHGTIDIISGGFPCQPFSVAGKRKGTDDNRYLWPEMLRTIRSVQPKWFVGENVGGLLTQQSGMVFERVCADMENIGYEVQSFIIPACAVGAPHRRDRVWIVAHSEGGGNRRKSAKFRKTDGGQVGQMLPEFEFANHIRRVASHSNLIHAAGQGYGETGCTDGTHQSRRNVGHNGASLGFGNERVAAHAEGTGFKTCVAGQEQKQSGRGNERMEFSDRWQNFPTESPVCGGDDGISDRLDGITFSKWRNESVKAYGNAIVPQIAYQIFKAIETVEYSKSKENEKTKES